MPCNDPYCEGETHLVQCVIPEKIQDALEAHLARHHGGILAAPTPDLVTVRKDDLALVLRCCEQGIYGTELDAYHAATTRLGEALGRA